jgi:ATP-dependent DNA helicase RecQ
MARYFPSTPEELRRISGVGDSKLTHFGEPFLAAIHAYKDANPDEVAKRAILQVPVSSSVQKRKTTDTVSETFSLIKEGLNVGQICSRRNLSPGTVTQHIEKLIEQGETLDVDQFIDAEKRVEIEALFTKLNSGTLGAVVEAGKGGVTYEQARIVRAFM